MSEPRTEGKSLLATVTGECFQPVRLHYRVLDHEGLLRAFKKLRCVDHDPEQGRWVWLYDHEARTLRFKRSYAQIPKDLHPIVIGSLFLRTKDELLLDLRSCERALLAIPFFDKHLPRGVAEVTEAEIVNKLFSAEGNAKLTPDQLFDHVRSTRRDPEATIQKIKEQAAHVQSVRERLKIALKGLQAGAKQPLPEIERLPVHYYEDGIEGFALAVRLRQIVAMQHWQGNLKYTLTDAIRLTTRAK
jgi:hypothetical protein